jgi:hypothetical protein
MTDGKWIALRTHTDKSRNAVQLALTRAKEKQLPQALHDGETGSQTPPHANVLFVDLASIVPEFRQNRHRDSALLLIA